MSELAADLASQLLGAQQQLAAEAEAARARGLPEQDAWQWRQSGAAQQLAALRLGHGELCAVLWALGKLECHPGQVRRVGLCACMGVGAWVGGWVGLGAWVGG